MTPKTKLHLAMAMAAIGVGYMLWHLWKNGDGVASMGSGGAVGSIPPTPVAPAAAPAATPGTPTVTVT